MANAYCQNEECEYEEDGCCEYEGMLANDICGNCTRFIYKSIK